MAFSRGRLRVNVSVQFMRHSNGSASRGHRHESPSSVAGPLCRDCVVRSGSFRRHAFLVRGSRNLARRLASNRRRCPTLLDRTNPGKSPRPRCPDFSRSASALLFEQGLADPRGCEYCSIEIGDGSLWSGRLMETHGWVMPGGGWARRLGSPWPGTAWFTRSPRLASRPTWKPTSKASAHSASGPPRGLDGR